MGILHLLCAFVPVLFMQGCGGGGGGSGESQEPQIATPGAAAPTVAPLDLDATEEDNMRANLTICMGLTIVPYTWNCADAPIAGIEPENWLGYPQASEWAKEHPAAEQFSVKRYYGYQDSLDWFLAHKEEYEAGGAKFSANFEAEFLMLPTPVDCAVKCREHPDCEGYTWWDPLWFNGYATNQGSERWPGNAYICDLMAADPAEPRGLTYGPLLWWASCDTGPRPVLGSDVTTYPADHEAVTSGDPNFLEHWRYFSGSKPDATFASSHTATGCPYQAPEGDAKGVQKYDIDLYLLSSATTASP